MTQTPPEDIAKDAPPRRPRHRRVGKWVLVVLVVKVLVVVIAVAALLWYARGRDFAAPEWVNQRIEERLARAWPDLTVDFASLTLSVAQNYQPSLHLGDVRIRQARGGDSIVMSDVTGSFDARALLSRQIRPRVISVTGARIHVDRTPEGQVGVVFGAEPGAARPVTRPVPRPADPAERVATTATGRTVDQTLAMISDMMDRPAFALLRRIEGAGLIVQYTDRQAERSWTVDGGQLSLTRDGEDLTLQGNFALLGGHAYATAIQLSVETAMHSRAAALSLRVEDAPARDIATQSAGLAWLGVLDAPISGALRVATDEDGRIGPLNGTLQIGAGALAPEDTAEPIPFDSARTYFRYDPAQQRLTFNEISVQSAWVTATAEGRVDLIDISNNIPAAMTGQMRLTELTANPAGIFPAPLLLERADAEMRLRFDPFRLDLGRLDVRDRDETLSLAGWVQAEPDGWDLSLTGHMAALTVDHLLELWPGGAAPKTREWVARNVLDGTVHDLQLGVRSAPTTRPEVIMGFDFEDLITTFSKGFPPVQGASGHAELRDERFVITADAGHVVPGTGAGLDITGTSFIYENVREKDGPAEVQIRAQGSVTDVLHLIDAEPLQILTKSGRSPDLAQGQAEVTARLNMNLIKDLPADQIRVQYDATLRDVSSDVIVPERPFSADLLTVTGTANTIAVTGTADLGGLPVGGTWTSEFGPDATGGSRVKGWVEVSQGVAEALNLGLKPGTIGGTGRANIDLTLPKGGVPAFTLTSDLQGNSIAIDALNWRLPTARTAALTVQGTLGQPARLDRISIDAPGLTATGSVTLKQGGGLDTARFDRVQLGGWLDAPVTLTGRGQGVAPAITIPEGRIDLRRAKLGGSGEGGPLTLALDQLTITDTITLTNMRADMTSAGGLRGKFTGRVNGQAPVAGVVAPSNGKTAVTITSSNAGAALAAAGLLKQGRGGALDLSLNPTGADGTYDGILKVRDIWLQDAPAMASLLSSLSVVGLLEQMSGNGINFTDVEADFRLTPDQVILRRSSAVGASMGIAMDGYYNLAAKELDMQGVVSPVYVLNQIGQVFTRKGEGLLGFNYRLNGPVSQPKVQVNPLSIFTPGMFREIFRRPAPTTN